MGRVGSEAVLISGGSRRPGVVRRRPLVAGGTPVGCPRAAAGAALAVELGAAARFVRFDVGVSRGIRVVAGS
ncbi:hypothetical protein [Nocardia nova]|uniref:hypothetical protein n=1 Tax=Nocardia nova TaxID=37330 RepID=UPI0011DD763C|nr:hypothetical protein [Nocardia nova]